MKVAQRRPVEASDEPSLQNIPRSNVAGSLVHSGSIWGCKGPEGRKPTGRLKRTGGGTGAFSTLLP